VDKEADEDSDRNQAIIKSFVEALSGEDELGMVVRAHIHIEHELRQFVISAAPNPSQVKFAETDFDGTVRLALVLGLDAELKQALNAAGHLRNKFSHKLEMKLGEQEAKNLFATLTPDDMKTMEQLYSNMENVQPRILRQAPIRDRIQMFFVMIFIRVMTERRLAETSGIP